MSSDINKLNVHIPLFSKEEIRYTLFCLLDQFLGVEYNIVVEERNEVMIICGSNTLIIENYFFSGANLENYKFPESLSSQTITVGNEVHGITSIYGKSAYNYNGTHILSADIISSAFFMLSRWEEYRNPTRDDHGRFQAKESLAYKNKFLEKPIVNEYVEVLWAILVKMGCTQVRKKKNFTLVPTHDVDKPYLFNGWKKSLRYLVGSLKRGRFGELKRFGKCLISGVDPFDTHSRLMDLAELNGVKANFFFLQKGKDRADENHEIDTPKIKDLFQRIRDREHIIGYHPSYNAYNDEVLFRKEKQHLERITGEEIDCGRHHFLRWDVTATPQIWQENNMKWDSTLGYADHAGFRCGVCYPFPLYDLKNNRQFDVYERPLIAMEWSLIHYQGLSIDQAEAKIEELKNQVKKYNGEFVFLYHNSAFFVDEYINVSDRLLTAFYN